MDTKMTALSAEQIVKNLQDCVQTFEQCGTVKETSDVCEKLMQEFEYFQKVPNFKDESLSLTIHEMGVKLWNAVVAKKTGKKINQLSIAQGKHVALHLTYIVALGEQSQTSSRKQQAMAMKCGKDWLDCGNMVMSETCFIVSMECYIKLHKLLNDEKTKLHTTKEQIVESHSNMIVVYLHRADLAIRQSQHATALNLVGKAKELASNYGIKAEYLCASCYNFGLECYQKELFDYSAEWLRQSLDIGNNSPAVKRERQATSRQLLAMVYMETKNKENYLQALEEIEQSILELPEVKSIHMKIKIKLLLDHDDEQVLRAFSDLSLHPSLNLSLALQTVNLFAVNERIDVCYEALEILNRKYQQVNDNIQVQMKKLEILLSNKNITEAKEIIKEELIRANNNGGVFDKTALKQLQLLIWEQANLAFEDKQFEESLYWYDSSLQFMRQCTDDTLNISKLQRNRATCLIELKQYEKALEAAEDAKVKSEESPQVYFLLYKIALVMLDDNKALDSVKKLSVIHSKGGSEHVHGLVCLAAQLAFESGNRKVAEVVLELLVQNLSNGNKESLVPIRCLTRLKFTYLSDKCEREDITCILNLIEKGHVILKDIEKELISKHEDEVLWFNKIAWNLALSCSRYFVEMEKCFMLCYEFSLLLPTNLANASQQETCLLMCVGCNLKIAREQKDQFKKQEKLKKVLTLISKCYQVSEKCNEGQHTPTLSFLLSYEFEAKAQLGETTDMDSLLEKTLELTNGKIKTLENFANVALTSSTNVTEFGIKALKLAVKCYLEQPNINQDALSKVVHSLISVSLQKGGNTNAESKADAFNYFQDTVKIIENLQEGYPEMELVWLMTKAWNCGIHLYSAQHLDAAEKWCSLSMKFLKFLKDLKESYEPHMLGVFTDIISRIQQSRVQMQVEE